MSEDTTCPNCGASIPGASDIPGDQASTNPAAARCPSCGAALGPEPQPDALKDGGWHQDGEPQA